MTKNPTSRGFSLIELLIVITIIGLLTTVILANSSKGRVKAQATRILSDFQSIEAALTFMAVDHGIARWWTDNDGADSTGGGFNCTGFNPIYAPTIPGNENNPSFPVSCAPAPKISNLISNDLIDGTADYLAKYLSQAPTPPVGYPYTYSRNKNGIFDPDGDNCSLDNLWEIKEGATIELGGMRPYPEIFDLIDTSIDQGDGPLCGKIRYFQGGSSPKACVLGGGETENCRIFYMLSANGKF